MGLKILVTGSTGMVGRAALIECLEHSDVEKVISITRRTTEMEHPKLVEIVQGDVTDLGPHRDELQTVDACLFCLGVSSGGMSKERYTELTYDLTINFARQLKEFNPNLTFLYVSGAGTDSTEKGRTMWARVKGKTENDLLAMGFPHSYMFRPAAIIPKKGVVSSTRSYRIALAIMRPFFGLFLRFPKIATTTEILGLAMIKTVRDKPELSVFESIDINNA